MLAAKLVLVDVSKMPQTHKELKEWVIAKSRENSYLVYTDVAKDVKDIMDKKVPIVEENKCNCK